MKSYVDAITSTALYQGLLAEPVDYALGANHSALNQQTSFDPATSTRTFIMAVSDIGDIYFLPVLMKEVMRTARCGLI
jgi:hypothetical protein